MFLIPSLWPCPPTHSPEKEKNNKISSNLKLRLKALGGIKGSQRVWSFEGVIGAMYSGNWHPLKGKKNILKKGERAFKGNLYFVIKYR